MTDKIELIIKKYWKREIDKGEFIRQIQFEIGNRKEDVENLLEQIIENQNPDELEYGLVILYATEKNNEMLDIIHKLILEPWHREYEELAHDLQRRKRPESIQFLKQAIKNKYEYLESYGTGTRQLINQCGHALKSIGTKEAINTIRELSKSEDPIIKDEMLYRISKIEGRNDYERNH